MVSRITKRQMDYILNPHRPGHDIQYHPRAFRKPIHCQVGLHTFNKKTLINGVVHLLCGKCGATISQGIYEKTVTKQDLQKEHDSRARQPRTQREILEESWRKLEEMRRENSDKSIAKYVKEKLLIGEHL